MGKGRKLFDCQRFQILVNKMWPAQASSIGITENFLKMQNLHPYSRPTES